MPPTKTDPSATERLKSTLETVRDIAAKAETEGRDLTDEERGIITAHLADAKRLKSSAALDTALAAFAGEIEAIEGKAPGSAIDGATIHASKGRTLGRLFTEDDAVKSWLDGMSASGGGRIPERARVQSPPVGFDGLKGLGYSPTGEKAVVTGVSDTSAGALIVPDDLGVRDGGTFQRPLNMLDVITRGVTGSDTVEYVRVTGFTNSAAPVPEASTAGAIPDPDTENTAGLKPESGLTLARVSETVKTIAHWIPATKRALSDAGQVRTLIDNFLRYGLAEELEDQIVNGDGSGENFTGILNTANVQTQDWATQGDAPGLLVTARKAKTKVRTVGRALANAYAFHPNDAERLDLLTDTTGRFYFGGPGEDGVQRLWRLPVVESEAIPEGTGVVGDWRQAVLWDREQAGITVSDSHADFFVRNLVAILAELRAAFGVFRPQAFVTFPVTEAATS